ncbi:MAG: alpha/beta fold hydrolase [Gemmatimonas sp.]
MSPVAWLADHLPARRRLVAKFETAHARRLTLGSDGIVIGAESIRLDAPGGRAALLLHGFNDTPQSMVHLARALHGAGWTVSVPRLPGHGVSLAAMARDSRAHLWHTTVERTYAELRASNDVVVVCGQSMGGALAVQFAAAHHELPALVLLAPYLGMPLAVQFRVVTSWLWDVVIPYRASSGGERSLHDPEAKAQTLGPGVITSRTMSALRTVARSAERALPRVTAPTLYLQSREDNRISSRDAERHFAMLGSQAKVQRWVSGCGHIISADYCRDAVAQQVIEWFGRHASVAEI